MTIDHLAQAAFEAHHRRLRIALARKKRPPPTSHWKSWAELAPLTREAWIAAVAEVLLLSRPREDVLRELGARGVIALRIASDE